MRIFFSRVTQHHEFLDEELDRIADGQHHFQTQTKIANRQRGYLTLDKLAEEIAAADRVLHCLHENMGEPVRPHLVGEFLLRNPRFGRWLQQHMLIDSDGKVSWSYTQFEAYYAIYLAQTVSAQEERAAPELVFVDLSTTGIRGTHYEKILCQQLSRHLPDRDARRRQWKGRVDLPREELARFLYFELSHTEKAAPGTGETHVPVGLRDAAVELLAKLHRTDRQQRRLLEKIAALLLLDEGWPLDAPERPLGNANPEGYLQYIVDRLAVGRRSHKESPKLLILIKSLSAQSQTAGGELDQLADHICAELGLDSAQINEDQRRTLQTSQGLLPPLRLEVHCSPHSDSRIVVKASLSFGSHRVRLQPLQRDTEAMTCAAIHSAKEQLVEAVRYLLEPDRVEIMSEAGLDLGQEYWHFVWEARGNGSVGAASIPTVLRWPLSRSGAEELYAQLPADDLHLDKHSPGKRFPGICIADTTEQCGVRELRSALEQNLLTVWRRNPMDRERPCLPDQPTLWRKIPQSLHGEEWRHVGVGFNPDEALTYTDTLSQSQIQRQVDGNLRG